MGIIKSKTKKKDKCNNKQTKILFNFTLTGGELTMQLEGGEKGEQKKCCCLEG